MSCRPSSVVATNILNQWFLLFYSIRCIVLNHPVPLVLSVLLYQNTGSCCSICNPWYTKSLVHVVLSVIHGTESLVHVVLSVIHGTKSPVHVVLSVIHGTESLVHVVLSVIHGTESLVHVVLSVIHGTKSPVLVVLSAVIQWYYWFMLLYLL
jgi:hypothetical protein